MSSARLLLALAVLGLAACAHTPSTTAFIMPDIRHAAPVTVKSSDEVPAGFDDHVIVSVDRDALRSNQQRHALMTSGSSSYYYYRRQAIPTSSRPTAATAPPSRPTQSAPPARPSVQNGQRDFGSQSRRSRN